MSTARELRSERKTLRILMECRDRLLASLRSSDITTRDLAECSRAMREVLEGIRECFAALKRLEPPKAASVTNLDDVRRKRGTSAN